MADVAHSTTSITGGHTNAVASGAAGFMSGTDKAKLDAVGTAAPPGTRTISAAGLATGGGDLSADRTITVTAGASGDIVSPGTTAAAGATGKAADAGHVHAMPSDTPITIQAVTAAALPAYTLLSGTVAGGDALWEANAVGAFPTLDGNAAIVAAASGEAVTARFLLHHGAATTDNGVRVVTVQGDGSTKYRFTMYSGLNTGAKTLGSKLRVVAGEQCCGAEYQHIYEGAFTLGTTGLFYKRLDQRMCPNEGFRGNAVCAGAVLSTTQVNDADITISQSAAAMTVAQNYPTGFLGEYQFSTGSSASAVIDVLIANPPISANVDIEIGGVFQIPTLSTVAQEFTFQCGLVASVVSGIVGSGICFVYDRLNKGVNLWAKTVAATVSTGTFTDTGITVTAGRRYRWKIIRRAGDSAARFYIGSSADTFALVATHSANHPTVNCTATIGDVRKVAGTTTTAAMAVSAGSWDIQFPARLAA